MTDKEDFIYPKSKYRGEFTPQNIAFDHNLQEFSQKISIICSLENNGKLSSIEAYKKIKQLWKDLKTSKKNFY